LLCESKNSSDVRSTSTNTAPNALTVAGVLDPGTKKLTSSMLLPSDVKSLIGPNVWNSAG
jgi:hypothetical protein